MTDARPRDLEVHVLRGATAPASLTILLWLGEKQVSLERSAQEPLAKTLERLAKSLAKKAKKQRGAGPGPLGSCQLLVAAADDAEGAEVDGCVENAEAWPQAAFLRLPDATLRPVRVDPPRVIDLGVGSVSRRVLQGCEVVLNVRTEHAAGCTYAWRVQRPSKGGKASESKGSDAGAGSDAWEEVHSAPRFRPGAEHVGAHLWLQVTPLGEEGELPGRTVSHFFARVIEAAPPPLGPALRSAFLERPREAEELRFLSYNILADCYTRQPSLQHKLFDYALSRECIDSGYRFNVLLAELDAYGADLLCLQEVDFAFFERTLRPWASARGFAGFHAPKVGTSSEGGAILVNEARFEVLHDFGAELIYRRIFDKSDTDEAFPFPEAKRRVLSAAVPLYDLHPDLEEQVTERLNSVTDIKVLRVREDDRGNGPEASSPAHCLIVANSHFYYHGLADHIRLLQMYAVLESLHELQSRVEAATGAHTSIVFAGDLNTDPEAATYDLMTRASEGLDYVVPRDHRAWTYLRRFYWGKRRRQARKAREARQSPTGAQIMEADNGHDNHGQEDEEALAHVETESDVDALELAERPFSPGVYRPALRNPLRGTLVDPYNFGEDTPRPPTNFTPGFRSILDYVCLQSPGLEVVAVAETPGEEVLAEHDAIPSPVFPSDHVALLVDVRLRQME